MSHKRVLAVCYLFPPLGGSGVQRSAKFAKYLPRLGWRPLVISARGRYLTKTYGHDPTLQEEIRNVRVWRLGEWRLRPFLDAVANLFWDETESADDCFGRQFLRIRNAFVDWTEKFLRWQQFNPWVLKATLLGLRVIRKYNVRVIYSSQPPIYSHVVGYLLSRLTGLPWVADYRDPYTTRMGWEMGPEWYAEYLVKLEARFIRQAAAVVSVGERLTKDMRTAFPAEPEGKFVTIRNGYDPSDFVVPPKRGSGQVTIVHPGMFWWGFRDPTVFMQAVADWVGPNGSIPGLGKLRIDFLGGNDPTMRSRIRQLGLQDVVCATRHIDHQSCVARLKGSDLILVVNGSSTGHALRTLPGKLYEAIGSSRPVLALTDRASEMAEICRQVGGCWVADMNDKAEIIQCLDSWASCMKRGVLPERSSKALTELTRQVQARDLARVFEEAHSHDYG